MKLANFGMAQSVPEVGEKVREFVRTYVCACACLHVCICMSECACMYVCLCVCIFLYDYHVAAAIMPWGVHASAGQ